MGTTIDGVYQGGKRARRERALKRLERDLKERETEIEGIRRVKQPFEEPLLIELEKQITRIKSEIETLKSRL